MNRVGLQIASLFAALFLFASPAHAGTIRYVTGNDLVDQMQNYEKALARDHTMDPVKAGMFMGYVTGVADATRMLYDQPEGVTKGQIAAIVAKYLRAHPENWSEPASDLVVAAMLEAFPIK